MTHDNSEHVPTWAFRLVFIVIALAALWDGLSK